MLVPRPSVCPKRITRMAYASMYRAFSSGPASTASKSVSTMSRAATFFASAISERRLRDTVLKSLDWREQRNPSTSGVTV